MARQKKSIERLEGDGVLKTFTFDFLVTDASHLLMLEFDSDGAQVRRFRGDDEEVDSIDLDVRSVTLDAAPADGNDFLIVLADDSPRQPFTFSDQTRFSLKEIEVAFDHISGQVQRLTEQVARTPKYNLIDSERILNTESPTLSPGEEMVITHDGLQKREFSARVLEKRTPLHSAPVNVGANTLINLDVAYTEFSELSFHYRVEGLFKAEKTVLNRNLATRGTNLEDFSFVVVNANQLRLTASSSNDITIDAIDGINFESVDFVELWAQTGTSNKIPVSRLPDDFATTTHLTDGAVTTPKIADEAVTEPKIGPAAVTEDKIEDGAVTDSKFADGSITEPKIDDRAVTEDKIGPAAVTDTKLAEDAVTTNKIINEGVTQEKLASGSVNENKIVDGAVTEAKLHQDVIDQLGTGGGGDATPIRSEEQNLKGIKDLDYTLMSRQVKTPTTASAETPNQTPSYNEPDDFHIDDIPFAHSYTTAGVFKGKPIQFYLPYPVTQTVLYGYNPLTKKVEYEFDVTDISNRADIKAITYVNGFILYGYFIDLGLRLVIGVLNLETMEVRFLLARWSNGYTEANFGGMFVDPFDNTLYIGGNDHNVQNAPYKGLKAFDLTFDDETRPDGRPRDITITANIEKDKPLGDYFNNVNSVFKHGFTTREHIYIGSNDASDTEVHAISKQSGHTVNVHNIDLPEAFAPTGFGIVEEDLFIEQGFGSGERVTYYNYTVTVLTSQGDDEYILADELKDYIQDGTIRNRGEYDSANSYRKSDLVEIGEKLLIAKQNTPDNLPVEPGITNVPDSWYKVAGFNNLSFKQIISSYSAYTGNPDGFFDSSNYIGGGAHINADKTRIDSLHVALDAGDFVESTDQLRLVITRGNRPGGSTTTFNGSEIVYNQRYRGTSDNILLQEISGFGQVVNFIPEDFIKLDSDLYGFFFRVLNSDGSSKTVGFKFLSTSVTALFTQNRLVTFDNSGVLVSDTLGKLSDGTTDLDQIQDYHSIVNARTIDFGLGISLATELTEERDYYPGFWSAIHPTSTVIDSNDPRRPTLGCIFRCLADLTVYGFTTKLITPTDNEPYRINAYEIDPPPVLTASPSNLEVAAVLNDATVSSDGTATQEVSVNNLNWEFQAGKFYEITFTRTDGSINNNMQKLRVHGDPFSEHRIAGTVFQDVNRLISAARETANDSSVAREVGDVFSALTGSNMYAIDGGVGPSMKLDYKTKLIVG